EPTRRERALQCGRNVFPVSRSVFNRERIRGHPSAFCVYAGSSSAHSSFVTTTFTASVSGVSSTRPLAHPELVLEQIRCLHSQDSPRDIARRLAVFSGARPTHCPARLEVHLEI